MKSKASNISKLTWNSSLLTLASNKKPSQHLTKIYEAGILTLKDLLWILPLRIQKLPEINSFSFMIEDELFLGKCTIASSQFTPAFGRRGKGQIQLFNATLTVKDSLSDSYVSLKWFNTYPSLKKQLEALKEFYIMGKVTSYKGQLQMINPKINPKNIENSEKLLIEYPTYKTIPGNEIKKIIDKVPTELWSMDLFSLVAQMGKGKEYPTLIQAFAKKHGKANEISDKEATERIVYEEFFANQLKVLTRKLKVKTKKAQLLKIDSDSLEKLLACFPYTLTADQLFALKEITDDFIKGTPMMRMVQGDVGCGKTSIALAAALIACQNSTQVAFMCPTETLANQHYQTFRSLVGESIEIDLLTGSTSSKEKEGIYQRIKNAKSQIIIGTHALIQESVIFKNLALAIIDEQHKFGVEQRQKLFKKGTGTHTLIMSATPIPRTLQLASYGDLDISTIRTLPAGRKGTQTRIVRPDTYGKYLSFLKTRASLNEQIYIVVPIIEESESLNLNNVMELEKTYQRYFPELRIAALHGGLKPEIKTRIMSDFQSKKIDLLISTTVIEVGVNVLNATVMAIYNPERFGLSSLHQLRGRVGRGEKAGFCFLITEKDTSDVALKRLKIIEQTNDGFQIAEADLKNRGEGNLFGLSQSGHTSGYFIASIFEHFEIFEKVTQDLKEIERSQPEKLNLLIAELAKDNKITTTI